MRRMSVGAISILVAIAACGDGVGVGDGTTRVPDVYDDYVATVEGAGFVEQIRGAEQLVVGEVFTEHRTARDLVLLAVVMCEAAEASGDAAAAEQTRAVVDRLDWISPAHGEMVGTLFVAAGATVCAADLPSPGLPLDAVVVARPHDGTVRPLDDVDATIQAFIESDQGQAFRDLVRSEERRLSPVFTEEMTDMEVVRLVRGICQTEAELGAAAGAEQRLFLETYGWTSESDVEMFDVLTEHRSPVCATVGN